MRPLIRKHVSAEKYDNQKRANHLQSISQVLIVADDLTGACDAAVPFAPATVWLRAFAVGNGLPPVNSISTESRDLPESEIFSRMRAVAQAAPRADLIFKKIDSTLRGNIPAEIRAAMEAFACAAAVITPAFPDMGRTVRDGHLFVNGVVAKPAGPGVLDASTNEDLDRIVETGLAHSGRVLWAGSAGLASALARRLFGTPKTIAPPRMDGPLAFCIGSDHPATLAQQAELARHCPNARILPIRRGETSPAEIRTALDGTAALFLTGGDTASMVLGAIGVQSIGIRSEAVTGVPWGLLSGGMLDGRPVVTKSGGFGGPDTLVRVADFFCPTTETNE